MMKIEKQNDNIKCFWKDRKRYFGLPISFTQYGIFEKEGIWTKLFVQVGLLDTRIEELHIYRIDDISVKQTLGNKIFGVGSIKIYCQDASSNEVIIKNVKEPYKVRAMINDLVESARTNKKIVFGEFQ